MSYSRFVIISHLRSGTHLLRTLLESHPGIVCQSELFNSDDRRLPYSLETPSREVLERWAFGDHDPSIDRVGFVLQAYHPWGLRAFPGIRENPVWSDIWTILDDDPDIQVIHLQRENLLRRHLSHVLARNTGTWHRWNPDRVSLVTHLHAPDHQDAPPKARPKVELDEQKLRLDFEEVEQLHFAVRERFEGERYFGLSYEDLASDPDAIGRQLLAFLRLEPFKLNAAVSKLEQRPLTESISNYDDLSAAFSETRWARFFES